MAQNFIACDREQELLLPPSLREWLPEGHLAWFVLDAVGEMDLAAFYAGYRDDGWGRAAPDPATMVALFVYAYAIGVRSSRAIERRCRDDVAFRVITANQATRSRDDRALPGSPRGGDRRLVRRGAGAVRAQRSGEGRCCRGRRHQDR